MIGLLTTLLVGQAVAGSITITRSGASVDEFVDGDNHSLKNSSYDHGILLGDGIGKATPVYRILLPPPTSGDNQIISITVTIEGNDGWLSNPYVYIGTPVQVSESIGDGEYVFNFTESDARNLLASVGDGLGYTIDVKIDIGGLTDKYDLKEIKVTYEYSGVSSDILERFAQAYSSYRTLKEYEAGMVDSLWNPGEWSAKEYFYPAVQQSLAFADNLAGLSGSLYDSLKSTINCIENFQSLGEILESAFDYTLFWINYDGPSKNTASSELIDARNSFKAYAQHLFDHAFDGDISLLDTTQLNLDIDIAKVDATDLRQTMWDVGQASWQVYKLHNDGDGKNTAPIMLYSLAPLLNITYDENSFNSEPSYLTGLIDKLIHFTTVPVQCSLTVTKEGTGNGTVTSNPAGVDCGPYCSETFDEGTQVILTAAADTGSIFVGWSGGCIGTGNCQVTMDVAKSITATFYFVEAQSPSTCNALGESGSWNNGSHWDCGLPPGAGTSVTIQGKIPPYQITINELSSAGSISLSDGGILKIEDGTLMVGPIDSPSTSAGIRINDGVIIQTGGTNTGGYGWDGSWTIYGKLYLGYDVGNTGTYELSDGQLLSGSEYIGYSGTGTFRQTGGTNTLNGQLFVGSQADSIGRYVLGGTGQLVAEDVYIGGDGVGAFIQTGGVNRVIRDPDSYDWRAELYVRSNGLYELRGGEIVSAYEDIVGEFIQTGGENTVGNLTILAGQTDEGGTYEMSAGEISAEAEYIGSSGDGTGTFIQTGGMNLVNGDMHIGGNSYVVGGNYRAPEGNYILSGGTLKIGGNIVGEGHACFMFDGGTLDMDGNISTTEIFVGYNSTASYTHTNGMNEWPEMIVGMNAGSNGTYELSGTGLLSSAEYQIIGYFGDGMFNQTGGTNEVRYLYIGGLLNSSGTYNISNGVLDVSEFRLSFDEGSGTFNILNPDAVITISDIFQINANSYFNAVPDSTIHMTGSAFENESTISDNLAGFGNLKLIFEGGSDKWVSFEVAGAIDDGFFHNFALGSMQIGGLDIGLVRLFEKLDNGNRISDAECIFVHELLINEGSFLDLNSLAIYVKGDVTEQLNNWINSGEIFDSTLSEDYKIIAQYDNNNNWTKLKKEYYLIDTDNDGIPDSDEDVNHNGVVDPGETDPSNPDTDGDCIQDGTELGYTLADIGPDTDTDVFQPDLDPSTTTNPLNSDTDGDGLSDGQEDTNHNGMFDPGELDPNHVQGDVDGDGNVNIADGILALQVMAGIEPSATVYKEADVNGDNKIGMEEVIYILQKVAGLRF